MALLIISATARLHTSAPKGTTSRASCAGFLPDSIWYKVAPKLYISERTSKRIPFFPPVVLPVRDELPDWEEVSVPERIWDPAEEGNPDSFLPHTSSVSTIVIPESTCDASISTCVIPGSACMAPGFSRLFLPALTGVPAFPTASPDFPTTLPDSPDSVPAAVVLRFTSPDVLVPVIVPTAAVRLALI